MRVSLTPRAQERRLPGGRREWECSIGEGDIRSHQDTLYHNLANHTNYPAPIPPGLRHRPINRATPHSFLPPHHTVNTVRATPILLPPVSQLRTTLLQTRRTTTTIQTIRATPRRTRTQVITNLFNRPISIPAWLTTLSLITFPIPWPTTPTTTNIIPMATIHHSRSNSTALLSSNCPVLSSLMSFHFGERRSVHMPPPVNCSSFCSNTTMTILLSFNTSLLCERIPQCPLP